MIIKTADSESVIGTQQTGRQLIGLLVKTALSVTLA